MKKTAILLIIFSVCTLTARCTQAGDNDDPNDEEENLVKIILTKLDVNDTNLELGWKITNNTDHDVWICDSVNTRNGAAGYEVFLADDAYTLVIRRRFDIAKELLISEFPQTGRYVPIRAGEERSESWSCPIPIRPVTWFGSELTNAEYAGRIALDIGFYDEDLPGLILHIVEVADKLECDFDMSVLDIDNDIDIFDRFFGGWAIQKAFYSNDGHPFRESVESGENVLIPYMRKVLHGEKILWLEINDLFIPYKGNIPLTSYRG